MTAVISIDLSQVSGVGSGVEDLSNARVAFAPYRAFADGSTWVTENVLYVDCGGGAGEARLPPSPVGSAYEVQELDFEGARHGYVLVPDGASNYKDLVWVDKATLEPDSPLAPAWVEQFALLQTNVDTAIADAATATAAAAEAQAAAEAATVGLATKVNTSTYTAGLALKANADDVYDKPAADALLGGKADLVGGVVPGSQLPSYVDDVLPFANLAAFPDPGESGKIYIDEDTNKQYRWAGVGPGYQVISDTIALGENSSTAYRGDRGKTAYDHSQTPGNPHGTTKADVGLSLAENTDDASKPISIAQSVVNVVKVDKPVGPMQFVIYGASQSVDPGLRCTPGLEWFKQIASDLGTAIASLAYSGRRTLDMAGYALSGTVPVAGQGAHPAGAAATWAGMDTVGKIPILDVSMNDIGHYPTMVPSPVVPALISGAAGARYVAGIGGSLRTLLATMCSQSRVENVAATSTGVWSSAAIGSGGTTSYTTAVGATRTYTVTPPQGGEFAGEVFHVGVTLSTESGAVSAPFTYSIDGGAESAVVTPPGWQRYVGWGGANIDSTPFVTKITLPVDGAAHTIRITHAGAAGNVLYSDVIPVPSETPKPILVLQAPRQVAVAAGVFDAAGVATYARNWRVIEDQQKAICSEFPNAIYVPCSVTPNGLSLVDGLHFNDRGMEQRKNDVLSAIYGNAHLRAALLANKSRAAPDGSYAML